jgi:hypothetical protein
MSLFGKLKAGNYTNKKGKHYRVNDRGYLENTETIGEFLDHPNVKRQLDGFQRMYMQQTLKALYDGEEPPNSVGGYGVLTKKKLKSVWDENWQAELDKMNEYYDVTYDSFFGVKQKPIYDVTTTSLLEDYFFAGQDESRSKDYPPARILLTASEIAEQYGSEKES